MLSSYVSSSHWPLSWRGMAVATGSEGQKDQDREVDRVSSHIGLGLNPGFAAYWLCDPGEVA